MSKKFFVSFEGPDGSGKTTIIKLLNEYLQDNNYDVVLTREPGGSKIAESIRDIVLDPQNTNLSYKTEALLYAASRAQHFHDVIKPALEQSKIVLCDRFLDSSLVYQGIARKLGVNSVLEINKFAIDDVMPDYTFFLDVDPLVGLGRIKQNDTREINRLDLESDSFHRRVYDGYKQIVNDNRERFIIIDANNDIDKVLRDTIKAFEEVYNG